MTRLKDASLVPLWRRRLAAALVAASGAAASIIWGWAAAQYPMLGPPRRTVARSAAPAAPLHLAITVTLAGLMVTPSAAVLLRTFDRDQTADQPEPAFVRAWGTPALDL
jgi:cytochrome d ubiquinol oxidase subunit II